MSRAHIHAARTGSASPHAQPSGITALMAVFAAGMWVSKVAQPLYFQEKGALLAFGVGYAAMAVAGSFAFAWGKIVDRLGPTRTLPAGLMVYALGIALRLWTSIPAVLVSGSLAGAGASLTLVAMRLWIQRSTQGGGVKLAAARNLGNQIGVMVGTVGCAAILAAVPGGVAGPRAALLAAPLIVVAGAVYTWTATRRRAAPSTTGTPTPPTTTSAGETPTAKPGDASQPSAQPAATSATQPTAVGHEALEPATKPVPPAVLIIKLTIIAAASGLYVSLVTPYLPLIFTDAGASSPGASLIVGVASFVQAVVTWTLLRSRFPAARTFTAFLTSEALTAAATLAMAALLHTTWWLVVILFLARAAAVAVAVAVVLVLWCGLFGILGWVEVVELGAGVGCGEVPVDAAAVGVGFVLPGG